MLINIETLRTRLAEAEAEKQALLNKSKPIRDQLQALDEQLAPLLAQARELGRQIKEIEAPIFGLDNERSMIAKALGGKSLHGN